MDEDLQLHVRPGPDAPDLLQAQLPGQDHPGEAQLLRQPDPLQVVDAHLGGGVAGQRGHVLPEKGGGRRILEDHGVRPGCGHFPHRIIEGGQLPVRHQGVHRHVDADAPAVAEGHGLLQALFPEIVRPAAGVEALGAQVDRVGAAAHRRDQLFPPAGGGQHLHQSITRTAVMTGWSLGRTVPFLSCTGVFSQMASTTSMPEVTWPKAAYCPFSEG